MSPAKLLHCKWKELSFRSWRRESELREQNHCINFDGGYVPREQRLEGLAKARDALFETVQEVAPGFTLKYIKHYIGLSTQGISNN